MIELIYNHPDFEYDVYGLVQSFFPKEEITTLYDVPEDETRELPYQSRNRRLNSSGRGNENQSGEGSFDIKKKTLSVSYFPGKIDLLWEDSGKKSAEYHRTVSLPADWPDHPAADPSTRPEMKNLLKRAVYELLSEITGKTLPWGTLTGIRPTKIPLGLLSEGKSPEEIHDFMRQTYLTSEEKIRLSTEIAEKEHRILSGIDTEHGVSVYIGIPFCPTTCLYCSFPSYAIASCSGKVDQYLSALFHEIEAVGEMIRESGKTLHTVYIGGGTPTSLTAEELERLFLVMEKQFDMADLLEFTVEAGRPDSITPEKLSVMKNHGVTRISINPQTMHDRTLRLIGRHHTVADLVEAFHEARAAGFDDINMDLILGLPGETVEDVRETLEAVKELGPEDLTIHSLAVKTKSRLNAEWETYRQYAMENSEELMEMAGRYAAAMGLSPYYLYRQKQMVGNLENVGCAKPGKEGIYNILIMEEQETILALGAGTASKYVRPEGKTADEKSGADDGAAGDGSTGKRHGTGGGTGNRFPRKIARSENVRDIDEYIRRIDEMIERKREKFALV